MKPIVLALSVLGLLLASTATATAMPLAKDGKVHACYRVKGKPKGGLRIVHSGRTHCRRGERKIAWVKASTSGPAGARGQQGAPGADPNESALKTEIAALTERVAALERVLPVVQSLCLQATALTKQVNAIAAVVEGLGLNGVLTGLGGLLVVPALPEALPEFGCASL